MDGASDPAALPALLVLKPTLDAAASMFEFISIGLFKPHPAFRVAGRNVSLFSCAYKMHATPTCRKLFMHWVRLPRSWADDNTGKSIAAKIAMIAITRSNSINVNASRRYGPEFMFVSA